MEHRDWGLREYRAALAEMRELRRARRRGEIPDTLILVEHPPVITVGVQGDDLASLPPELPVVPVERGGHSTYHAPGQLVGYPIVDLDARGRDVRRFVGELEAGVIEALATLGVPAEHVAGQRGVWVEGTRKIASIGIAVEEWVSFHGVALNVDLDLAPFARFRPCGLDGAQMTSVARELGRRVPVSELTGPVRAAFDRRFNVPTAIRNSPELLPAVAR
ncbi:MAG TPA: lipoyl(octanoyl) transferase LipB [Thermoplasmata archaeon]|nr:lipoyl(octanoyl) transferase LipB [Thermoplasmata archaeon]